MDQVREVLTDTLVSRVPGAKPWVRGLANVHGCLVTVADTPHFLRIDRAAAGERESAADARAREEQTREINRRNQEEILRLLDEISDLADGDLSTNATATEGITGAIADAINYATDALRETVTNINSVSVAVAGEARSTRETAVRLTDASETHASQITSVAGSIEGLASAGRTVSANADRSRELAEQAVQFANDGNTAVRATIDGMDNIRETIQETSKRIKRLGESSQEIGEIVGLIDDIADQTNILALNAAIQASMAGEQGRGFLVVADEVQRLAERASQALIRIEMVSNEMAGLVTAISGSAFGQTTQADAANESMAKISEITAATTSGMQDTSNSVGRLAQLAADLRTSVAGVQLPDSAAAGGDVVGLNVDDGPVSGDANTEPTPVAQAGA